MADGRLVRVRLAFEREFTQIPNEWLRDPKLTLKARGLLALLMSHDAGFTVTYKQLVATNPEGYTAILAAVKELQLGDYLEVFSERGRHGRVEHWVWKLTDPKERKSRRGPQLDFPDVDNAHLAPDMGYPDVDNPRLKEAHSEEQLTRLNETAGSTRAGDEMDALTGAAVQSPDLLGETRVQRFMRLQNEPCPKAAGKPHDFRDGLCGWCLKPAPKLVGAEVVTS